MTRWLQRVRGAVGMGVTWALGWAVGGLMIGASSVVFPGPMWDTFFRVFDAPLPALGVPGFFGGAIFSVVLGVAGRRRRFDDLSIPAFAAWGALGGLLLCLVPLALAGLDVLTGSEGTDLARATLVIAGPFTLLGAASASTSLALARRAQGGTASAGSILDAADDDPRLGAGVVEAPVPRAADAAAVTPGRAPAP